MTALYNEIDPKAAAWIRELIAGGHIAPGDVDERSIEDLEPDYVSRYTQFHGFAGIAGWSLALRRAGWPDDRPVWTMSCPCQPFSAAGKRGGTSDERHLWPSAHHLIDQCRPPVVFGEQVASKDGLGWFDLVSADLEGSGYAVGASDLCAAGVGAPHIRQRLWFVGVADAAPEQHDRAGRGGARGRLEHPNSGAVGPLEHATGDGRLERRAGANGRGAASGRGLGGLADASGEHLRGGLGPRDGATSQAEGAARQRERSGADAGGCLTDGRPGPVIGVWRDADWLYCRDGKWRPVEAGTFPLAARVPNRVGLLRGYGNAIVPEAAQAFIEASLEALDDVQRLRLMSDLAGDVFG